MKVLDSLWIDGRGEVFVARCVDDEDPPGVGDEVCIEGEWMEVRGIERFCVVRWWTLSFGILVRRIMD